MKRFLIPLLTAIAFPTVVNAEIIYLRCSSSSEWYPYFEIAIDESKNKVNVFGTKGNNATLNSSQGNFYIQNFIKDLNYREIININRFNGKFDIDVRNEYRSSASLAAKGRGKCIKASITERAF